MKGLLEALEEEEPLTELSVVGETIEVEEV